MCAWALEKNISQQKGTWSGNNSGFLRSCLSLSRTPTIISSDHLPETEDFLRSASSPLPLPLLPPPSPPSLPSVRPSVRPSVPLSPHLANPPPSPLFLFASSPPGSGRLRESRSEQTACFHLLPCKERKTRYLAKCIRDAPH